MCRPLHLAIKRTDTSIWSACRSESAAYTRHPACPYDARLMQLNINTCAGFDAGAFSAPHPSDGTGKLAFDIRSSVPTARSRRWSCSPEIKAGTRRAGFRPSMAPHSEIRVPQARRDRPASTSAAHTSRSMNEGRDCFGGTAYSLIEEI
ncbi:hypothetical protein Bcep18194_A3431 [Burkholderia lata]|uniref:Uncharacterized protein n=1 Tax=Burkholderia lata (strain ATCC 17760 / DSM 23089 / LMG 22485 / NCIMB 9086 / R18194 / 383) TaxID=482957 RepID=Q39KI3_BURL3|nr:hypothetical protein Bcep18194_A3431 [Burkholderia lata]